MTPRGQVSARRISDRTIARIIKRHCEAIGQDPRWFDGHSLRAGLITLAFELGLPEWKVRLTSRSEKSRELNGYFRPAKKRKHALTNVLGF